MEWYVPAAIVPEELQRSLALINQFLEKPIDLDLGGKGVSSLLQRNRRARRRRRARSPTPEDSDAEDDEPQRRKREKKKKEMEVQTKKTTKMSHRILKLCWSMKHV